jgi:hypothetical protein
MGGAFSDALPASLSPDTQAKLDSKERSANKLTLKVSLPWIHPPQVGLEFSETAQNNVSAGRARLPVELEECGLQGWGQARGHCWSVDMVLVVKSSPFDAR